MFQHTLGTSELLFKTNEVPNWWNPQLSPKYK